MRFNVLAVLLGFTTTAFASAIPEAAPEAVPQPVSEPISGAIIDMGFGNELDKRACTYNGCTCSPNIGSSYPAGIYCGKCFQVYTFGSGGKKTDAYQCGKGGSCCRYGARSSCASSNFSP